MKVQIVEPGSSAQNAGRAVKSLLIFINGQGLIRPSK